MHHLYQSSAAARTVNHSCTVEEPLSIPALSPQSPPPEPNDQQSSCKIWTYCGCQVSQSSSCSEAKRCYNGSVTVRPKSNQNLNTQNRTSAPLCSRCPSSATNLIRQADLRDKELLNTKSNTAAFPQPPTLNPHPPSPHQDRVRNLAMAFCYGLVEGLKIWYETFAHQIRFGLKFGWLLERTIVGNDFCEAETLGGLPQRFGEEKTLATSSMFLLPMLGLPPTSLNLQ